MPTAQRIEVWPVNAPHRPVLRREVLGLLGLRPGARVLDGTLGAGGHAAMMLQKILPGGCLYGIDRDRQALQLAGERLAEFGDAFVPIYGRHEDLAGLLEEACVEGLDAILLDLGVSSMQLDQAERGFSFRHDAALDMRMDPDSGVPASELLATIDEAELRRLLWTKGEEKNSRRIARAIVREREKAPIATTGRLAEIVEMAIGPVARKYRIHPATRTFQAIRIATNQELDELGQTLRDAVDALRPGGRIAVISYHSLEDRITKQVFAELSTPAPAPRGLPLRGDAPTTTSRITRKPVRPQDDEIETNPRARSARLRVVEKNP